MREEMCSLADDSAGVSLLNRVFFSVALHAIRECRHVCWYGRLASVRARVQGLDTCICAVACVCHGRACVSATRGHGVSLLDSICWSSYWFCFLDLQSMSINCVGGASFGSGYRWRSLANCGSWISIWSWLSRSNLLCNHLTVIIVRLVFLWL